MRERYKSFGMAGKKHSKKTRKKMSESGKGKIMSKEWCQKISASSKGKKKSKEHIENLKKSIPRGKKHFNWKGGIKKKIVYERFNYTCKICKLRDPEIMEIDHIKPKSKFPELTKDPKNLQVLCPNCHRRKTNREKRLKLI